MGANQSGGTGPSTTSPVVRIRSPGDLDGRLNEQKSNPNQLLVVDFSASWCGPCKFMEPHLDRLAENHQDVIFVKVDVDELPDVAKANDIQAMPTFVLFKGGKEVTRIIGAKKEELEKKIKNHKG